MLAYEPDETFAHRLDPRSKLAFQVGFALAAIVHTTTPALLLATALTGLVLVAARTPPLRALRAYRFALVLLAVAPLVATATLGPPWIDLADGIESVRASYRVVLILLVSAAYVRSTSVRESRAAIQRTIPGKPGQLLGTGIGLVFRFLPVMRADLRTIRAALAVRLGDERSTVDRASRLGILGLSRAFDRADRLALALQARCFSWNPTLPPLTFSARDVPVLALAASLVVAGLAGPQLVGAFVPALAA